MEFPCTGCGECCRRIQSLLEGSHDDVRVQELVDRFPYKTRSDGSCEMLGDDGRCSVYEHRPLICNVKMGGVFLKMDEMTWYQINADGCNRLIDDAGLDESFKVVL